MDCCYQWQCHLSGPPCYNWQHLYAGELHRGEEVTAAQHLWLLLCFHWWWLKEMDSIQVKTQRRALHTATEQTRRSLCRFPQKCDFLNMCSRNTICLHLPVKMEWKWRMREHSFMSGIDWAPGGKMLSGMACKKWEFVDAHALQSSLFLIEELIPCSLGDFITQEDS